MSFSVRRVREKSDRQFLWFRRAVTAIAIIEPLREFYLQWKKRRQEEAKERRRVSILKQAALITVAVLIVLLLLAGVVKAFKSVAGFSLKTVVNVAGVDLPHDDHGFTNILLLGQGDEDHDGKDLTDMVMIASVDAQETRSVVLLSLPRDLYFLHTDKMGAGKLNSFYRDYKYFLQNQGMTDEEATLGAMAEVGDEVGRALGIQIHRVVKADFTGFIKGVDVLGGVDIEVPYDIDDAKYPDEHFGYEPFSIKAGPRHLDGATALKYARSRSTSSDFDRSYRQQQILTAIADSAKANGILRNPSAITSLLKILSENVKTTMPLREIIGAASLGEKIDRSKIITMQLSDRNALYNGLVEPGGFLYDPPRDMFEGAAVLLPTSIPEFPVTWKQIQTLKKILFDHREIALEHPTIAVLNAGAPEGTARKLGTELSRYGFNVEEIANAKSGKRDTSLIVASSEPDTVVDFFATLLALPKENAPEGLPAEQLKRIVIILGKDARYSPLQDLVSNLASKSQP